MTASRVDLKLLLIIFLIGAFSLSAFDLGQSSFGWHNQQRLFQLVLLCVTCLVLPVLPIQALPSLASTAVFLILALGLVSSIDAAWPEWALKEWARYLSLILVVLILGSAAKKNNIQNFILWIVAISGVLLAAQFIFLYASAFLSGIKNLHADLFFSGFSNPRFFGQFQILLMPILAWQAPNYWRHGTHVPKFIATLLFIALAIHWCIALSLGGRGLWLGLAVSHVILVAVAPRFRRLLFIQLYAAAAGFLLFYLLFKLLPDWLDITPILRDNLRTTLSSREKIWLWAWEMAIDHPWLGAGPMHFSSIINPVAAHPHQVILQWLAEWGFIATGLALALGLWGLVHGLRYLRSSASESLDAALWASIMGALILAQVDGVFVMPYTETWLAILIGIALARWSQSKAGSQWQSRSYRILSIPAVIILGFVLINDAPTLRQDSDAYMTEHATGYTPRFWSQGWIPMKPDK